MSETTIAVDEMREQCQRETGKTIAPLSLEMLTTRLRSRREGK
jgi:hypothetical protein